MLPQPDSTRVMDKVDDNNKIECFFIIDELLSVRMIKLYIVYITNEGKNSSRLQFLIGYCEKQYSVINFRACLKNDMEL